MATITPQAIVQTGLNPGAYASAAGGGDQVPVAETEKVFIHVKNGHTSSQTVTVNSQQPCDQGADHDLAVAVPNAQERMIGPLPRARFVDANGMVQLTYSGVVALTLAAFKLP